MNDDAMLTLAFWVVAIVLFVVIYLIPIALLVTGLVLWRKKPHTKTLGVTLTVLGGALCLAVAIGRISEAITLFALSG
jgi:hypothetical protein